MRYSLAFGRTWLFLALLLCPAFAVAQDPVTLGVLAFRPKPETLARWQATTDYLTEKTGRHFLLEPMSYPELEAAISQRRVDFVLTNPAHYVLMTKRNGLSSPLATLIDLASGQPLSQFGGVIFTRAGRTDIKVLADLRGKILATPDTGSLGGYQMQALELKRAGIHLPEDANVRVSGMPHDTVLVEVLEGRADAGFIRTGVLESLIGAGKLSADQIHVFRSRQSPGFPFLISTRLYPEWPIAAMPQADPKLAQAVATALFALRPDHKATRSGQYHGWGVPTDYEPVRDMMQELRLPPFDKTPDFTWRDVFDKHRLELALAAMGGSAILILFYLLIARQKQIRHQEQRLSEERKQLLAALGEGVYGVDSSGLGTFFNPAALTMLGYREDELLGHDQHVLIHHHHPGGEPYASADCPIFKTLRDGQIRRGDEWFFDKDGNGFPVEMTVSPIERDGERVGAVVVFHDIRARQEAQIRDRLLVSALESVANGIVITDQNARIEWVNPAFETLTGYRREEVTGLRPAELVKSGLQNQDFYADMWKAILSGQTWRGEIINKKRDGSLYNEELIITPVLDASGAIRHFVGIKQDISVRKHLEAELHNLATTDPLTNLPNRRHFLASLEQEMARLQRLPESMTALLMLDLDHFKLINDSHGHAAGDMVLRRFAALVRDSLRKTDLAGRLGGEEFAILLIGSDPAGAREFADRLREQFGEDAITIEGKSIHTTVSIGITRLKPADSSADEALARADKALYRAKSQGRNRVEME